MLGYLILEYKGKIAGNRILDSERGKMEASILASGKVKEEIDVTISVVYWNIQCGDGLRYGEGKGEITTAKGHDRKGIVKVSEYGVGKQQGQKILWRGSAFYQTPSNNDDDNKFSFLHGMVGVFETEVDEAGNIIEKVWEWK